MKRLRDEIESMKAERAELQKQQEAKKYQDTYSTFVDEIKTFVNNTSEFDFVKANNAYHVVAEVMQEHYNSTQEVMSYDDATKMVEDYYEAEAERAPRSAETRAATQRAIRSSEDRAEAGQAQEEAKASEKTPPKTLTNTQVQRAPGVSPRSLAASSLLILQNKYGNNCL